MKMQFKIIGLIVLLIAGGAVCVTTAAAGNSDDLVRLGMHLYKDKNLSVNRNQSCQTCHHPLAGFADLTNHLEPYVNVVSLGSDGTSKGGRNAPTSAYAGYSPNLDQDENGEWFGGMFWDGRMDGSVLGDPLAEQAQGPPLNELEMAMPSKQAVIDVIMASAYYDLWISVFGAIDNVEEAYDNFGRAIAAYERSSSVTSFSSKYDVGRNHFTRSERDGMALFQTRCASCHPAEAAYGAPAPLFTTYGYANIGVPVNPLVILENPDLGLGPIVSDEFQNGKFKIPTLRNIAMTAPYSHNGSFPTLYDMVSFINDSSGYTPEVGQNVVDGQIVGALGLSEAQIDDLIAFLKTLTDEY